MPDPTDPALPGLVGGAAAVIVVLVIVVFVGIVALTVYRAVRLSRQGVNPLTLETDLAAKALQSDVLRRSPSKAERLAELDALVADGRISATERDAARARILAE